MRRDVFQAIADPVRRDIIELLYTERHSVNEIAAKFKISRPAISKHLKILGECGLVRMTPNGRQRYFYLDPKSLIPAFLWIDKYNKIWADRIDDFEKYINDTQNNNKNKR